MIRKVVGESMLPTLAPGRIIVARRGYKKIRVGDIVLIAHDGLEKIKRVELRADGRIYVTGDNSAASTDSRSFGWLSESAVLGRLVWPRNRNR